MNAYLVTGPAYHRLMCDDGLPHPAVGLRLSEIGEQQDRVLKMLEQGGAIIVHSDDGEHLLGVLTATATARRSDAGRDDRQRPHPAAR